MSTEPIVPGRSENALRVLGGRPASRDLANRWAAYLVLPPDAWLELWPLIIADLVQDSAPTNRQLEAIAAGCALPADQAYKAFAAAREILLQASKYDLSTETLARDLVALSGEPEVRHESLLSGYQAVKAGVRPRLLAASIRRVTSEVTDFAWRIDTTEASDCAYHLHEPLVHLTFWSSSARSDDTVSIAASIATIESLAEALQEILRYAKPKSFLSPRG